MEPQLNHYEKNHHDVHGKPVSDAQPTVTPTTCIGE